MQAATTAPSPVRAELAHFTADELAGIEAAKQQARHDAEQDRGTDNCGLTSQEVDAWVRQAEAEAIAAIHEDRDGDIDRAADRLAWIHDGNDPEDYEGPGWQGDDWAPTPIDLAELAGWSLGLDGIEAIPPEHYTDAERNAFLSANLAGYQEWRSEAGLPPARICGPELPEIPFEELVEAGGVDFARQGGPR